MDIIWSFHLEDPHPILRALILNLTLSSLSEALSPNGIS